MITRSLNRLAGALSPSARKRVHHMADRVLEPFGSVVRARRPTHLVALTFDDGPHGEITPRLLDLLCARDAVATFFVLTEHASRHPELIRRMIAEGHEVALHCDRHDRLTRLRRPAVHRKLADAARRLEEIAGAPVKRFRPPFGSQSLPTIFVANRLGLEIVVWGPVAEDWIEQTPAEAADKILQAVKGGEIALLHDGLEVPAGEPVPTFDRVEMVGLIVDGLRAKGLEPTSVARMVDAAGAHKTFWVRA
jgi:peptidoglycan/xylan/chitin deacetylase (PgdA/CDA1 family)